MIEYPRRCRLSQSHSINGACNFIERDGDGRAARGFRGRHGGVGFDDGFQHLQKVLKLVKNWLPNDDEMGPRPPRHLRQTEGKRASGRT